MNAQSLTVHDSLQDLLLFFEQRTVTTTHLLAYFQQNAHLLRQNLAYAPRHYDVNDIQAVVDRLLPVYIAKSEQITANYRRFNAVQGKIINRYIETFGNTLPKIVIVPCIGTCTAGGWADTIDGVHHVFVAMEHFPLNLAMDILIAHEIAHATVELAGGTVLSGFYDEGFASYMSAVICQGYDIVEYFYEMDTHRLQHYLAWIHEHRAQIVADAPKPFVVLDDVHKLYFTTSYSDVPNIGYVIGFLYLHYLAQHYTISELRTFAIQHDRNQAEFATFINTSPLELG